MNKSGICVSDCENIDREFLRGDTGDEELDKESRTYLGHGHQGKKETLHLVQATIPGELGLCY